MAKNSMIEDEAIAYALGWQIDVIDLLEANKAGAKAKTGWISLPTSRLAHRLTISRLLKSLKGERVEVLILPDHLRIQWSTGYAKQVCYESEDEGRRYWSAQRGATPCNYRTR